jgi:tRNA(Arg) A34 adenosine deaminase TadA
LAKRELQKFKQDQLKLKRENKVEETDKPYEVVSFKSENKVSLKKKNRREKT